MKIGLNETTIGIELSPFVLELARYRLLPSAYNQIFRGNLYGAEAAHLAGYVDKVCVRRPALSLNRSGEPFGRTDPLSYRRTKEAMPSRCDTGVTLRPRAEANAIKPVCLGSITDCRG